MASILSSIARRPSKRLIYSIFINLSIYFIVALFIIVFFFIHIINLQMIIDMVVETFENFNKYI